MSKDKDTTTNLKKITIEGFKSIKSINNFEIKPINILIGANGSGKSNFLSVFDLLGAIANGNLKSYVLNRGGANKLFHYGTKTTENINFELDFDDNNYKTSLIANFAKDSISFKNEICGYYTNSSFLAPYPLTEENGESGLLPGRPCGSTKVQKYTRNYLNSIKKFHFHDTSKEAQFKQRQKLTNSLLPKLLANGSNVADVLYSYKENKLLGGYEFYKQILQAVQAVIPYFDDFVLEPEEDYIRLRWKTIYSEEILDASDLSDGTARFILMAVLFLQKPSCKPKTIILDEPELGLHPKALDVLADIIKDVSKSNQVICATQSVELANCFDLEDFIVVEQNNGISTFTRPSRETLKHWLEEYGMGDIWNKNLIGGRP